MYKPERALELLRLGCGLPEAEFREGPGGSHPTHRGGKWSSVGCAEDRLGQELCLFHCNETIA